MYMPNIKLPAFKAPVAVALATSWLLIAIAAIMFHSGDPWAIKGVAQFTLSLGGGFLTLAATAMRSNIPRTGAYIGILGGIILLVAWVVIPGQIESGTSPLSENILVNSMGATAGPVLVLITAEFGRHATNNE